MGLFDFLMGRRSTPTSTKYQNPYGSQNKATATAEKNDLDGDTLRELRGRFIAFDVETTGLSCITDRIVELGAVVFENGIPTKQFSTLVNPNIRISASASAVNHITNEMLARAPKENTIYPEFVNFMADSLKGGTHLVAHNASFDMNFLKETLMRLGYDAKIRYIDTLSLSRKLLSLPDNKQDTVAGAFGIVNEASHRAVTDAKVCGQILWQLLDIYEKKEEKSIRKAEDAKKHQAELAEKRKLSDKELEICACLQKMIYDRGGDTVYLRFYKNSSGYVDVVNIISIIKFKFTAKKGQYIVIPAGLETPSSLPTEKCSVSEGGTANIRLYFANPSNLDFLGDFMLALYKEAMDNQSDFLNNNPYKDKWLAEQYGNGTMTAISIADMDRLIERSRNRDHDAVPEQKEQKPEISKEDVTINPVNTRCPIKDIKNLDNPDKGYAKGVSFYDNGEVMRKDGNIDAAIALYDKAREEGYFDRFLYISYSKAYHKIKDYDNEIAIIDEYTYRAGEPDPDLETRQTNAVSALYKIQQAEKAKEEKAARKAEKEALKAAKPKSAKNKTAVCKVDDYGIVLQEYPSIREAADDVGIDPKGIRDVINGRQKHAGGFVWKYKETREEKEEEEEDYDYFR